jgi:SAM-dependent methyltransferase
MGQVVRSSDSDSAFTEDSLPAYAAVLSAYHRAHADELRAMIAGLPLRPGDQVLDMACGDGAYSVWLAERVAPNGHVTGVDISPAFLAQARELAAPTSVASNISFEPGDIDALPFADHSFDLVWCAQSMYSLPEPRAALRELRRVTRPGGRVAIFENDTLHHLVLPWPPELELAVRQAQLAAMDDESREADRLFIGRDLCAAFGDVGIADCVITPYSTARQAPLGDDEVAFLGWYLDDLRRRARPFLGPADREAFDGLTSPDSPDYLLSRPDFMVTYLNIVAVGVRPQDVEP